MAEPTDKRLSEPSTAGRLLQAAFADAARAAIARAELAGVEAADADDSVEAAATEARKAPRRAAAKSSGGGGRVRAPARAKTGSRATKRAKKTSTR